MEAPKIVPVVAAVAATKTLKNLSDESDEDSDATLEIKETAQMSGKVPDISEGNDAPGIPNAVPSPEVKKMEKIEIELDSGTSSDSESEQLPPASSDADSLQDVIVKVSSQNQVASAPQAANAVPGMPSRNASNETEFSGHDVEISKPASAAVFKKVTPVPVIAVDEVKVENSCQPVVYQEQDRVDEPPIEEKNIIVAEKDDQKADMVHTLPAVRDESQQTNDELIKIAVARQVVDQPTERATEPVGQVERPAC